MRTRALQHLALLAVASVSTAVSAAQAQSTTDTRLLSQPAVSATRVAFAYSGDLWTAKLDGSDVRRITTADGDEINPAFSPDGAMITFSANYDGNTDVYVVSALGGAPKRLTFHPGGDGAQGLRPTANAYSLSPRATRSPARTRNSTPCRSRAASRT